MSAIELHKVSINFGGLKAVNDLSIKVDSNQIFSIIGPNGAGKTTAFNLMTGIFTVSEGRIFLEDSHLVKPISFSNWIEFIVAGIFLAFTLIITANIQTLWDVSISSRYIFGQPFSWIDGAQAFISTFLELTKSQIFSYGSIGFLLGVVCSYSWFEKGRCTPHRASELGVTRTFQNIRLFKELTALENVLVGMHRSFKSNWISILFPLIRNTEEKSNIERAGEILNFVGLSDFLNRKAGSLSYGHQRRLEIGRALAANPDIILLDEPAAGLNPSELDDLLDLIKAIKERGITVLLIEHHMKLVMNISERIAVLDYGNKIAEGTPDEIRNDPKVIKAYLGEQFSE